MKIFFPLRILSFIKIYEFLCSSLKPNIYFNLNAMKKKKILYFSTYKLNIIKDRLKNIHVSFFTSVIASFDYD